MTAQQPDSEQIILLGSLDKSSGFICSSKQEEESLA